MGEEPLVSIVTPSFNQGRFLPDCLKSVADQDYPRIEHFVVDGGSTDETLDVLRRWDGHEIQWVSEPDRGQSHALNKGFRKARGEIFTWLNCDDTLHPGAVGRAVRYFQEHPEWDMVYGEGRFVNVKGEDTGFYPTEPFRFERLAEVCFICQPASFFRAGIFRKVGGIDERWNFGMDYDLWIRIAKAGRIEKVGDIFATARMYDENKTLASHRKAHQEYIRIVKSHFGTVPPPWIFSWAHT
ncbi:MAG: glycosyltransferase family 2 protein, partial [Planctomycetota bacterium]